MRVSANVVLELAPAESVAVAVTCTVPLAHGLPLMRPVPASIVRPNGRPVAAYRIGGLPPVAVSRMVQDWLNLQLCGPGSASCRAPGVEVGVGVGVEWEWESA